LAGYSIQNEVDFQEFLQEAIDKRIAKVSAVEAAAKRTLDLMPPADPNGPPKDAILLITVVIAVIKLIVIVYTCWKDRDHNAQIIYNPSWLQRLYLRRVIKRVLKQHGQLDKLNAVTAALLAMARASTPEDVAAIFDEARSDPEIWGYASELGLL
jgi:hypothetical protein